MAESGSPGEGEALHKEEIRELERKICEPQAALEQEAERRSRNLPPTEHSVHSSKFAV